MPHYNKDKYCVVAVGRAYTDVIADVSKDFLEKRNIPFDAGREFDIPALRKIQSELKNPRMVAGGSSANTVAVLAALGGKAGFFGKVCHDEMGDFFLEDFRKRGVSLCCDPFDHQGTMSAVCLVLLTKSGHRSFVMGTNCAEDFSIKDFRSFDFRSTDFFLIDVQLLSDGKAPAVIRDAIEYAQDKTKIVFSFHNVNIWKDQQHIARYIVEKADILIGNDAEQTLFHNVLKLQHPPHQIIVTTKGENGVEARVGNKHIDIPGDRPKHFVSSVGAGDSFLAGFLFGLSKGLSLEASLKYGVKTALAILEEVGARPTHSLMIRE